MIAMDECAWYEKQRFSGFVVILADQRHDCILKVEHIGSSIDVVDAETDHVSNLLTDVLFPTWVFLNSGQTNRCDRWYRSHNVCRITTLSVVRHQILSKQTARILFARVKSLNENMYFQTTLSTIQVSKSPDTDFRGSYGRRYKHRGRLTTITRSQFERTKR